MALGKTIVGGDEGIFLVPAYGKGPNFIVREANGHRSREEVTVAMDANGGRYPEGMVMQIGTGNKFVPYTTGDAVAILWETIDVRESDRRVTIVCRDCEVQRAMLIFADGANKDKAYEDLALAHVVMR